MKRVTRLGGDVKKKSTAKVLRVAAYCRVSTGSDAQLESLDAQKTHYENYINGREDWEFAGLYFDEGISGTKKEKRPALLQMIADCKAGKIDFVITKSHQPFCKEHHGLSGDGPQATRTGHSDLFREGKPEHKLYGK